MQILLFFDVSNIDILDVWLIPVKQNLADSSKYLCNYEELGIES